MTTLYLGMTDADAAPTDLFNFLKPFHETLSPGLQNKTMFRDEGQWRSLRPLPGKEVAETQQFLEKAGFLQPGNVDGIFGYRTRAAVRLFQEYVRTIEKRPDIGWPDGVVGEKTREEMDRWAREEKVCEWAQYSLDNPTAEFTKWWSVLDQAKKAYEANPPAIFKITEAYNAKLRRRGIRSDTRDLSEWTFNHNEAHLIGIRRNQDIRASEIRQNDDLFVLLVKGMAFKFWGSTDPNPMEAKRPDEPFLTEGQHLYKIGFHKFSNTQKAYLALKPLTNGPLIFRDKTNADALTDENVKTGISGPNNSINIHWSGIGSYNFSAGCQVIAGQSYMNHNNEVIDCSAFASKSYGGLKKVAGLPRKTKGAYNVISDLVSVYRPASQKVLVYTLGRDSTLKAAEGFTEDYARKTVRQLKEIH